jgi:hypothetical protein
MDNIQNFYSYIRMNVGFELGIRNFAFSCLKSGLSPPLNELSKFTRKNFQRKADFTFISLLSLICTMR